MTDAENKFRTWMDARGLKTKEVADALHIEEQTVRHWRSQGVPPRRQPHVQKYMDEWKGTAPIPADVEELRGQPLIIEASREQFRRWNLASLTSGKLIEDWAIEALDEAAKEFALEQKNTPRQQQQPQNIEHLPLAADEPAKYRSRRS